MGGCKDEMRPHVHEALYMTAGQSQDLVACCLVIKSCPILWDPMNCSSPGSSVHGIFQARILEWVTTAFSRGSSWPRDQPMSLSLTDRFFTTESPGKHKGLLSDSYYSYYSSVHRSRHPPLLSSAWDWVEQRRSNGSECGWFVCWSRGIGVSQDHENIMGVSQTNSGWSISDKDTSQVWATWDAQVLGKVCFPILPTGLFPQLGI